MEATGIIEVNDIKVTSQRYTYICGKITEADGDESGFLAKFMTLVKDLEKDSYSYQC